MLKSISKVFSFLLLASFALVNVSSAQELSIVAPAGAGGGWDGTARAMQQALLEEKLATNVQVSNIPGSGGTIGLAQIYNSNKGDGNLLLMTGVSMVGAIISNKSAVTLSQVTPIARLTQDQDVIVVPKNSRFKNFKMLADALKADASKVSITGGSAGGVDHILAGLIIKEVGGDPKKLNYIPYSGGGESVAEIISGRVDVGMSGYSEYQGQIESGQIVALAVSGETRLAGKNIPTIKESGVNLVFVNWRGVMGAPGISEADRKRLDTIIGKLVKTKAWASILESRGWNDYYQSSDDFAKFIKQDEVRIAKALSDIGVK